MIAILCRDQAEIDHLKLNWWDSKWAPIKQIHHSYIEVIDGARYTLMYRPELLQSYHLNAWTLSPQCHERKDLESFIKEAIMRIR